VGAVVFRPHRCASVACWPTCAAPSAVRCRSHHARQQPILS